MPPATASQALVMLRRVDARTYGLRALITRCTLSIALRHPNIVRHLHLLCGAASSRLTRSFLNEVAAGSLFLLRARVILMVVSLEVGVHTSSLTVLFL